MLNEPYYSINKSVSDFIEASQEEIRPTVLLHSSCVLEPISEIKELFESDNVNIIFAADSLSEIQFLAKYSTIDKIRETAAYISSEYDDPKPEQPNLNEYQCFLSSRYVSSCNPLIIAFYSAASAEYFTNSLSFSDVNGNLDFDNTYLLYYNFRYTGIPEGRAKMYTEPVPIRCFEEISQHYPDSAGYRFRELEFLEIKNDDAPMYFQQELSDKNTRYRLKITDDIVAHELIPEWEHSRSITVCGNEFGDNPQSGGEAFIFDWKKDYCMKIYKTKQNSSFQMKKLKKIERLSAYSEFFSGRVTAPVGILYDESGKEFRGFLMRKVTDIDGTDKSLFVLLKEFFNQYRTYCETKDTPSMHKLYQKSWEIIKNITLLLLELRLFDIDFTDLSLRNILIDKNSHPILIDFDSAETFFETNTLYTEHFCHKDRKTKPERWFVNRKYTDFAYSVLIGCIMLFSQNLLFSKDVDFDEDSWSETKNVFSYEIDNVPFSTDAKRIPLLSLWKALSETQRKALIDEFRFRADYSIGAWINLFRNRFFG